jgi:hypothetical protein
MEQANNTPDIPMVQSEDLDQIHVAPASLGNKTVVE